MAIGDLVVRVGADIGGFVRDMDTAGARVGKFRGQVNSGAIAVGKYAAAATAAGAAIAVGITRSAAQAGQELANLSRLSNTSTTSFQRNAIAARTVGIEQQKLADIYKDMQDRVGDFIQTGGGPMADFFERIAPQVGVTVEQFRKLSGPQGLQLFVDSLEKANLSQSEMVFQMEAMASDSSLLIPLLSDGGAAIRELGDEAERTGRILSEIDVKRLQLAGQQMAQFDATVETLKNQLGAQFAPILAGVADLIEQAAIEAGGFGNLVEEGFGKGIEAARFLANTVGGVQRTFEIAGKTIAVGLAEVEAEIWTLADGLINGPIAATNAFIELINNLPNVNVEQVGFSDLGMDIFQNMQEARGAVNEGMADIRETINRPLPGDALAEWVENVKRSSDEAATSLEDRMSQAMSGRGDGLATFDSEEEGKGRQDEIEARMQALADENARRMDLFRERYFGEESLRKEHEERMRELEAAFREQGIITEQEYSEFRLQNMQDYMERQVGIQRSGYDAMNSIVAKGLGAEAGMVTDALGSMINSMSSQSKKAFEIKKALAISNAVVGGYDAAVMAWEAGMATGGPLAPAVAAAYTAASLAKTGSQIAAIKSQSFGSGGGGSAGGGGGGTAPQAATSEAVRGTGGSGGTIINIRGVDPSQIYTGEQIDGLISAINERGDQGMTIRTSS